MLSREQFEVLSFWQKAKKTQVNKQLPKKQNYQKNKQQKRGTGLKVKAQS